MTKIVRAALLAFLSATFGCAGVLYDEAPAESKIARAAAGYASGENGLLSDGDDGATAKRSAGGGTWGAPDAPATAGRKMIYSARFGVLVPAVEDAVARLVGWVEESGGYLKERADGTVVCKVPVARFFPLLDRVRSMGVILSEALEAKDVTREMQDLEIRLDNARRSRTRLLDLLERATDVEAILKIEAELRRLTDEIERMEGALRLLTHQVEFSTLTVDFSSNAPAVRTRRGPSRFVWVRSVGAERVLEGF
ncbi:MAG: DUF4349 domain-containing protein [Planctomycetota bacterium JB042]